jgi:hypothetical protein
MNDGPPPEMIADVLKIYNECDHDREKYEIALNVLADSKGLPANPSGIRKVFVNMCLEVFDRMESGE